MGDLGLDGKMIMKFILKQQDLRKWNKRITWLRIDRTLLH
jgi:hypothetical protein